MTDQECARMSSQIAVFLTDSMPERTVSDLTSAYIDFAEAHGIVKNGAPLRSLVRAFAGWSTPIRLLSPVEIQSRIDLLAQTKTARGTLPAASTQELRVCVLRQSLKWAVEQGWLTRSPMPPKPRLGGRPACPIKQDAERFTIAEAAALLHDTRIPPYWRTVYSLPLYTGCRVGELLELRWDDLVPDDVGDLRWVIARQWHSSDGRVSETKTGRPRIVPIHRELRRRLETYAQHTWPRLFGRGHDADDLVFPSQRLKQHMWSQTVWARLQSDLRRLKFRRRSEHALRATFISILTVDKGQSPLLVEWLTHRTVSKANGGVVVGGYARGRYEAAKAMLHDCLNYPERNTAQLALL